MDLPAGYRLRAPTPDDLDAIAAVMRADDLDDAGQAVLGAEFVKDEWSHPAFVLATDAWVVLDGAETVVAYATAVREEPTVVESWGVVHPEHRGRGIGSKLVDLIDERASALLAGVPAGRVRNAINAGDRVAAAILRARGFERMRHFWHMQIDLDGAFEAGPPPEGIEITTVEPTDDLSPVHAVMQEAFAEEWGFHAEPFGEWLERQTTAPSYDPTLWLLATENGRAVAALTATILGERGWVADLGVARTHRGRGIGAALLRRSFATFAERGLRHVMLNVDSENPTGATALYERVGMRVAKRWDLWERAARASS